MKWIKEYPYRRKSQRFFCSKCTGTVYYIDSEALKTDADSKCKYKYCPHCGERAENGQSITT